MQLAPGAVVGGKYRIERPLARGGMGSLWVARHAQLGSTVAVKFLDPAFAASAAHRMRFEREARAAANIKSPHVVHVQDFGFEGAAPYLVMELLDGEDLGQRLHRIGRMSLRDTGKVLVQIGRALRKAHEAGIVHRDIKPANVFIARVDDDEVVKILDFGIAKEVNSILGDATRTGEVIGSPHYMSPEQVRAEKDVDHRTDLWSLGIILFVMIVGTLPFPGDQLGPVLARILTDPLPVPSQFAPDLPPSIDAFFARALARDKTERFQTIGAMVEAFQAAAGGREAFGSLPMSFGVQGDAASLQAGTHTELVTGTQAGATAGTAGGLATTGAAPPSKGPGVVLSLVAVVLMAGAAAAAAVLFLVRSPFAGAADPGATWGAPIASSELQGTGAAAPPPSAESAPPPTASAGPASSAAGGPSPAASASAGPKPLGGKVSTPNPKPTSVPATKEKWF